MLKQYGDTDFVTGMRAYAALAVLITHAGGGGLIELGDIASRLVALGGQGVAVFFVISGYSVSASYVASKGFVDYAGSNMKRNA